MHRGAHLGRKLPQCCDCNLALNACSCTGETGGGTGAQRSSHPDVVTTPSWVWNCLSVSCGPRPGKLESKSERRLMAACVGLPTKVESLAHPGPGHSNRPQRAATMVNNRSQFHLAESGFSRSAQLAYSKHYFIIKHYKHFTKQAQSLGSENLGPQRPLPSFRVRVAGSASPA